MHLKKIAEGDLRHFEIVIGLQEGYEESARIHTLNEVTNVVTGHLKKMAALGHSTLSGVVTGGQMCYAWPKGDGEAESRSEPVAIYQGDVSPIYNPNMTDGEALGLLLIMAEEFAKQFKQTRMYLSYRGKLHVFQRDDTKHPRD